jgi:ABC-2 type transport system ATP-binding protein
MGSSLVGSLPLGWKQRIAFGAAVMHDPEVIFLDEPTAGVDPLARRQIWSSIRDFAKRGAAILVTTHYLDEAEYCNRLSFVSASKMVAEGTPTEVKSDHDGELFELVCQDASQSQKAFSALATELEPWRISVFGKALHVLLDHGTS